MMNGYNKRNLFEKITLLILFLLALPFIVIIFLAFILIFLVISPFEYPFYRRSAYNRNLKGKYYLTITISREYKTYNKFIKEGVIERIAINEESYEVYWLNDLVLIPYILEEKLTTEKKISVLVKQSDVTEEFYRSNRKNKKYLFY